jgi:hypothetical protein
VDIDYDVAGSRVWALDHLHPRKEIVFTWALKFIAFPQCYYSARPRRGGREEENVCQVTSISLGKCFGFHCSSLLRKKVKMNVKIGASL